VPSTTPIASSSSDAASPSNPAKWSDEFVDVLIAILDKPFDVNDPDLVDRFLAQLQANVLAEPKKVRLAKVLQSFVRKHRVDATRNLRLVRAIADKTTGVLKHHILRDVANLEEQQEHA
jgi:hypothetical protein